MLSALKSLIPLYSGGLWEEVIITPASALVSLVMKASTGVGVNPSL